MSTRTVPYFISFLLYAFLLLHFSQCSDELSPYNQHLPNCSAGFDRIEKKTTARVMLCPMIRDEAGFLSEWVAYYEMHGIDHFFIFDDGSIDNGITELQPWIEKGIVTVRSNWTVDSLNVSWAFRRNDFKRAMTIKALLESECKHQAIAWGYDFYISLDIDEYLIPTEPSVTIADELVRWVNYTGRYIYCIDKNNFPSTPHLLEPIDLLTIEAYQTRMPFSSKMNYYTSVSPKCAYLLKSSSYTSNTTYYIAECCHFHGCQGHDFRQDSKFCNLHHKEEIHRISGYKRPFLNSLVINHYSRSLEKYALKSKTWQTASGEAKAGETAEQAAKGYDIAKFLQRSVGWKHDNIALRYSCQLREHLQNRTKEEFYLRPGTMWYRNPEYGKLIADPEKRGRYGRPNPPNFKYNVPQPFHYHGQSLEFDKPSSGNMKRGGGARGGGNNNNNNNRKRKNPPNRVS
eukprot:gene624-679_t